MDTYKKTKDGELEVTRQEVAPAPTKTIYERSFIENQIKTITEDRDKYFALRNTEIEECENILIEMDKLGITAEEVKIIL